MSTRTARKSCSDIGSSACSQCPVCQEEARQEREKEEARQKLEEEARGR